MGKICYDRKLAGWGLVYVYVAEGKLIYQPAGLYISINEHRLIETPAMLELRK